MEGLYRVDPVTGTRALVSDLDDLAEEPGMPVFGLAVEPHGNLLIPYTGSLSWDAPFPSEGRWRGFNPVSGALTVVARGSLVVDPVDVALAPNGDIILVDDDFGFDVGGPFIVRIDRSTGARTIVSSQFSLVLDSLAVERDGDILVTGTRHFGQGCGSGGCAPDDSEAR